MKTREKNKSMVQELGISNERSMELIVRVAKLFAEHPIHSAMLQELVCDMTLDTKELVFCSFTVGALKEDPKTVMNILLLETAQKLGMDVNLNNIFGE
jgi:hypothetical protein